MSKTSYIHGYTQRETERLLDQAGTLVDLLHSDTSYPPSSKVLEAGCGIGAQTVILANHSPDATIYSVDVSKASLDAARERVCAADVRNVVFQRANIFALPFDPDTFDHVFICFVLEHLPEPGRALACLWDVLKPGGTITAIEGDHGSAYFHPDSPHARKAIQCLVDLQARAGGNSQIGRMLYPLLSAAGFQGVRVSPRMVYVDSSRPKLVEGFTKKTFTAMVAGIRERALAEGLIDEETWDLGIRDLGRAAQDDGTFCYTFFKARGTKPART